MKLLRYAGVAFESIMSNKMRSILTMLGLIIGVASVLTTIGIGRGAALGVSREIEGQGINTLTINPKMDNLTDSSTLTSGDAKALADTSLHPEIAAVAPTNTAFVKVVNGSAAVESQVSGDHGRLRRRAQPQARTGPLLFLCRRGRPAACGRAVGDRRPQPV